ncbi:MAG: TIGR03619 family F420-dependent LLM class oxidoreductase [Thaumarchaeota archaeon]|nr:TIGR03619 family F420-dependent LLM class oxidoreductase [Nitrososphaerota archaeon]
MKFGVCVPNYGDSMSVDGVRSIAIEAEKLGYDSIWTTDHLLMPKNSGTPYEKIVDSITTLAFLAPQTSRVKLGISSLVLGMRNPVVVAKQLASLDAFTGGRILLAMSVGWNEKEFSHVGSDFRTRGKRLDEGIRLIRSLWRGETEFHSKILPQNFESVVFEPRPTSEKLTIWIGGASEAAMKRAVSIGDAWHPNVYPMEIFTDLVSHFRQLSPEAKNKDICIRIGLNTKTTSTEYLGPNGEKRIQFSGNMSQNRKLVKELDDLGVSDAVLVPSPDGKVPTPDQIQSIRSFATEFLI